MSIWTKLGSVAKKGLENKAKNTDAGKAVDDTVKKVKKIKTIAAIASFVGPSLIAVLMTSVLVLIIMLPIVAGFQGLEGVSNWIEKAINTLSFRGFNSNEEAFFKKLRSEYNDYNSFVYRTDELDIALISASVHYGKIINSDFYENPDDYTWGGGEEGTPDFSNSMIVSDKETRKFYEWANERLGSSYTLYLDKRGLLGALTSGKITKQCMNKENAPSVFDAMKDIAHQMFNTMTDTGVDQWNSIIGVLVDGFTGNLLPGKFDQLQDTYQGVVGIGYDVSNIIDFKGLTETTCGEDEVAIPAYYKFNDYDKFDNYLRTYFIPKYLLPKDVNDKIRDQEIEKILKEIYQLRDGFRYLTNYGDEGILYTACDSVTVTGPNAGTYSLEEYIAGVVQNEVPGAGPEVLRAQAIAARTFLLAQTNSCANPIENSEGQQTFSWPLKDPKYLTAAYDTAGLVLTFNGKVFPAFYASYPKDGYKWNGVPDCKVTCTDNECTTTLYRAPNNEPNEFTMPRLKGNDGYWNGKDLNNQNGHCMGMSQVGAIYFEEEKGYKYEQILNQFYSMGFNVSSLSSTRTTTGLVAGNYKGYLKRVQAPTKNDKYFNAPYMPDLTGSTLLGQCVWYIKGRSIEIISTVEGLDADTRAKAIAVLQAKNGNGRDWFDTQALSIFGSSTDYTKPKVGAIAVWEYTKEHLASLGGGTNYGHVAIVEEYDEKTQQVTISEGWRQRPWIGSTGWADVRFNTATHSLSWMKNGGGNYRFLGYIYLLD